MVHNGDECWCSNSYGNNGPSDEAECNVRCKGGYAEQNCGGNGHIAVYVTEKGRIGIAQMQLYFLTWAFL